MNRGRTILVVAANPSDENRLRLDIEVRDIDEGLRLAKHRHQFILKQASASRVRDLHRAMQSYEPTIVHFIGHGSGEQGIIFEDNDGKAQLISAEALARFFELFEDIVECVVLNACYSETQAKAIAEYVPYVIGMSESIGDRAAIEFSVGFYTALAVGKDYEKAYKFGCNAIEMAGIPGYLIPQLFRKSKEKYIRSHEPVSEQAISENRWKIIESFFSDLGAKLSNVKTKKLFSFSSINGRLDLL